VPPTSSAEPTERVGLTDEERFEAYAKGAIYTALRQAEKARWIEVARDPAQGSHDLHDTAAIIVRQLRREGVRLTPGEDADSLL
jgi:hypothetical protein